ncbi:MAG: ATP-binding cassette domain-containing protein [Acidobacteriota bacterium]
MTAPPLVVEGAGKRYGDVVALDDVSLRVDGGVVGLLGANGAGKSTLMRAVLDLVPLDVGTIRVDGLDSVADGVEARRRVGYLPEELRLYDRLTGVELLELVLGLKGLPTDRSTLEAELAGAGLAGAAGLLIAEYSLGMRKKLALASALAGAPRLVVLDEPLNGLDTEAMRALRLRLRRMAEEGIAVLLSSHVMSFVERVCDRLIVLRAGRVVAEGDTEELRRAADLPSAAFEDVFLRLAVD